MKKIVTLILALSCMVGNAQWISNEAGIPIVPEGTSMYNNEAVVGADGTTYFIYYHPNVKEAIDEYDTENVVYEYRLQAIDKDGVRKFGDLGILISDYPNWSYCVVNDYMYIDKDGNVIVSVTDARDDAYGDRLGVYAYKISPDGEMLWGEDGITLDYGSETTAAMKVIGLADGSYVFAWMRTCRTNSSLLEIDMQRLSSDGKPQWETEDVALTSETITYQYPYLVDAGMNQFILVYAKGGAQDLYARKIDFDGSAVWGEDTRIYRGGWGSIPLWTILDVQPSGDGGVILGWNDDRSYTNVESAYMSYVTKDGKIGFSATSEEGDVKLSYDEYKHFNCKVMADPAGDGFIAFWRETSNGQSWQRMTMQKVSKEGELLYGEEGMPLFDFEETAFGYNSIQAGNDGEAALFYMRQNAGWGDVDVFYVTFNTETGEFTNRTKLTNDMLQRSDLTSHICQKDKFWIVEWQEEYKDENNITRERHMLQRIDFGNENDTTYIQDLNVVYDKNISYSDGQLVINASEDMTTQIEIFDLVGRKVTNINNLELNAGLNNISWTNKAGVYIAKLRNENEVSTCKIIVE